MKPPKHECVQCPYNKQCNRTECNNRVVFNTDSGEYMLVTQEQYDTIREREKRYEYMHSWRNAAM